MDAAPWSEISGNASSLMAATTTSKPCARAASSTRKGNLPFPAIRPSFSFWAGIDCGVPQGTRSQSSIAGSGSSEDSLVTVLAAMRGEKQRHLAEQRGNFAGRFMQLHNQRATLLRVEQQLATR